MLLEEIGPNQLQRTNSVGVVNGWKSSNLPYVGSTDSVPGSPRYPSYCIFFYMLPHQHICIFSI